MKLKAFVYTFVIALVGTIVSYGQSNAAVERTKAELQGPILEQYQYILDNSYNYTTDEIPFEVIKNRYILAFKAHLSDSLQVLQQQIDRHDSEKDQLNLQLEDSASTIEKLKASNENLSTQTSSIDVLGMAIDKTSFKLIVLILVIALIVVIVLLSSKLKNASVEVEEAKSAAAESQQEQERFRRTSMQREQQLKRELLDLSKKQASSLSAQSQTAGTSTKKETKPKKDSKKND